MRETRRSPFPAPSSRPVLALLALAAAALAAGPAPAAPARFLTYPEVRGETVVFSYEGDLFRVPLAGGVAVRLTTHPGTEDSPRLSPDGKWIAFRASYDGAPDVYLMPAAGGPPKRLTWFGDGSMPVAWTPDGKKVVFRSGRENTFRPIVKLYTVSPEGELPERLPVERGVLCSFSPDGTKMVYNRRGNEEYYWKRYKGGQYQDIWLHDFKADTFQLLTDYVGKNAYPMWVGDSMLFVSDRGPKGISNLYRYSFATKAVTPVTEFGDFDVQMPSTDGKSLVFVRAGWLYAMDVATGQVRKVDVDVPSDRWELAPRTVNATKWIQSMAVASDGKRAAFEARGDVFVVPADDVLPTRDLTRTTRSRERFPAFSPDGKQVAFLSDRSGEYQIYRTDVAGGKPWEQLTTTLDRTVYRLEWSPDGTKLLFGDKDLSLFVLDVATKKLTRIATSRQLKNDEFSWEMSDYAWSPDGKWVAYSQVEPNRNARIWLYSLANGKATPVTDGFYDSLNPSFDAKGDLLYFLSYRNFTARIDPFEDDAIVPDPVQPMAVQLKAGLPPPFEKLPKDEASPSGKMAGEAGEPARGAKAAAATAVKGGKGAPKAAASPSLPDVTVDLDGIASRVFPLPVKPGNYFRLKAGKGIVTWAAAENGWGEDEIEQVWNPTLKDDWSLRLFDVASRKEAALDGKIADWRLSPNGEQVVIRKGETYTVTPLEKLFSTKSAGEKLDLSRMTLSVVPADEWAQVFDDAWRWYRDFFYDPAMHGRDWKAIGAAYREMVPSLSSRGQLNWLLSQMVGELCVSHTYVGGGDPGPEKPPEELAYTGLLGADLAADASGRYRFAAVFRPSGYTGELTAPLARPDVDVKEGDYLIAIDGEEVKAPDNPYRHLQVVKGQTVRLTVSAKADGSAPRTYDVTPVRSDRALRYDRWVAGNVAAVDKASGGQIGYLHLTAMGAENVAQFDRFWRAFHDRKGIVVDVRGNGGGWTEYFVIDKLERKLSAFNVLKQMTPFPYPPGASAAHLAVLTNEYNGSDGEAFVEHFKDRKLGTVIGVPSWGGLVGIVNGQRTVDGGTVQQSNNAFWGREGKWLVENHGADPDILVDNDPASASAGRDLQLEKAIEVLKKEIAEKPFTFAPQPAYPKK